MISPENIQTALDNVAASLERNSAELGATISSLIAAGVGDLDWRLESRGRYATTDGRYRITWHGRLGYSLTRRPADKTCGYTYVENPGTGKHSFRKVSKAKAAAAADAGSQQAAL